MTETAQMMQSLQSKTEIIFIDVTQCNLHLMNHIFVDQKSFAINWVTAQ